MIAYFNNLYHKNSQELFHEIKYRLLKNKKMFLVTVNPESFMTAKRNKTLDSIITNPEYTIVADGIGILKGCQKLNLPVPEKIPGIDIASYLLKIGNTLSKTIFLLGASKEVNLALVNKIKKEYPNLTIVGAYDGYQDSSKLIQEVLVLKPDIIMVALGIPKQEILIESVYSKARKGIFIGVGGAFDVMSGSKKRAPKFFLKTNTEWLYRILKEPKRMKRFYQNNIRFLWQIRK